MTTEHSAVNTVAVVKDIPQRTGAPAAKVLAAENAHPGGKADGHCRAKIKYRPSAAHRRQRPRPHQLPDDDGIGQIVALLKQVGNEDGDHVQKEPFARRALGEIAGVRGEYPLEQWHSTTSYRDKWPHIISIKDFYDRDNTRMAHIGPSLSG